MKTDLEKWKERVRLSFDQCLADPPDCSEDIILLAEALAHIEQLEKDLSESQAEISRLQKLVKDIEEAETIENRALNYEINQLKVENIELKKEVQGWMDEAAGESL